MLPAEPPMPDPKKTLQVGTPDEGEPGPRSLGYPGAPSQPGVAPPPSSQPFHHPPAPQQAHIQAGYAGAPASRPYPAAYQGVPQPAHGSPHVAPGSYQHHGPASEPRAPASSQPDLPHGYQLRQPSQIPPPPTQDPHGRHAPPPGTRTPSEAVQSPLELFQDLPANPPGWMLRARRLAIALEQSVRDGRPSPSTEACIERAWAAWQLDGSTDKQITRVAQLIETAHGAIRGANEASLGQVVKDVADVVWAGLPRATKNNNSFEDIVQVVRALRAEPDAWAAAVSSTAKILGWTRGARSHAAHAIRCALMASRS